MELPDTRGFAAIGLVNPKNSINVGSALRNCGCFGASLLIVSGARNRYRKAPTDTQKAFRHMPLQLVEDMHDAVPYDCVPVAVDLVPDATPLHEYEHPERALYVFGPEDGTLGESTLSWCRDRIYIPTSYCLNLAVTTGAVLYDRQAKQLRKQAALAA